MYKTKKSNWKEISDFDTLFDEQFSIEDFGKSVRYAEEQSESILDSARFAIKRAYVKEESDPRFFLEMSDDIKEAIEKGEVRLDRGKNGEIYAQLRCSNGRFGGKISVKEELENEGITPDELESAMMMNAIREQLDIMIMSLNQIGEKVAEVLKGQRNDRIGLFYSGLSLYLEARTVSDQYLKKQLLAQALKSISDSYHQVLQDMKESIIYLINEKYKDNRKTMLKNIDERLEVIRQCYGVIFKSTFLKATIYQEIGEIHAMLTTMKEYGRFVEKLIVPHIGELSELDRNSIFIEKGIWGQMANTLIGCNQLIEQLSSKEVQYLSLGGKEHE